MKLKDTSVSLRIVNWRLFKAATLAESVFEKFGLPLIITSGNDGTHKPRNGSPSLHYVGLALDFRIHDAPTEKWQLIKTAVQDALGSEYVVILEMEPPHLHVQYRHYIDYQASLKMEQLT